MGEHTKGEWIAGAYSSVVGLPVMAQPDKTKNSIIICGVRGERAEAEANARLIAAAPALLEALRIARDFIGGSDATWDGEVAALEAIDAALSAASGRAPTNKEE